MKLILEQYILSVLHSQYHAPEVARASAGMVLPLKTGIFWLQHQKSEYINGIYFPYSPGGRLNKKDGLTRYGDSHVKDKTS